MTPHSLRARPVAATATALLLAGATAAHAVLGDEEPRTAVRGAAYVETRLLFGTARPDGGSAVTDRQFMDFVDHEVTPQFPGGLTVREGRGRWRDAHGVIERERSYELGLLYPVARAAASDRRIEEIRSAYERAFAQESVGRVDDHEQVDF
ncbi:DUF3574 domain-containing protein [Streptomyces sp. 142MFCol3.1]|uniref:DUF3574 domain-containing protein n=1 Tax=Streptomyces sp. 142MFCol3.1 TaxID=1172179 RepID=UPI000425FFB5|nr:DUF3574 domain-containing protein [Streptomyces sp. 142MFCol3.1]